MAYDGFISYSHAADGRMAPALQEGLQRLAKPWNARRALRIFRDETGLSTNPGLWSAIEKALDESEWFVLLASQEAAQSEWVNKEISHWLATKAVDRILPVVTDGSWEWDRGVGDFTLESSAVPQTLRGALADEPRHLDLRWARSETDLDLRNAQFRLAVADLAAPMHGMAKDELEGEDIRQHRRARRLARGAMGALTVLVVIAVLFGVLALVQRNSARTATAAANERLLVSESQAQLGSNRQLATLLALEADRRAPSAATRNALVNAVVAEPPLERVFGTASSSFGVLVGHGVIDVSTNRGTTPNRDVVQVWDWQSGRRVPWRDAPLGNADSGPVRVATTDGGQLLAIAFHDGRIQLYSGRTLEPQGRPFSSGFSVLSPPLPTSGTGLEFSANGHSLAVSGSSSSNGAAERIPVRVFSLNGTSWVPDPRLVGVGTSSVAFDLSSDGSVIATASTANAGGGVTISDVLTGKTLQMIQTVPVSSVALDWARHLLVVSSPPDFLSGTHADATWYDLSVANPTPHVIDQGLSSGFATIGYDPSHTLFGIDGVDGFGIFNAATLTPLALESTDFGGSTKQVLPPLIPQPFAPDFVFLGSNPAIANVAGAVDAERLLTGGTDGQVSLWDLSGLSGAPALATMGPGIRGDVSIAGVTPYHIDSISATDDPRRFLGFSSQVDLGPGLGSGNAVTVLGPGYRPLGAPIVVDSLGAVCLDGHTDRIATISAATGDLVIHDGSPPFRVLSRAPGLAANFSGLLECGWAPDGRWIALIDDLTQPSSVALYDVASRTLLFDYQLNGTVSANGGLSADSKTLWVSGIGPGGGNGVHEITDFGRRPKVRLVFPGATSISEDPSGDRLVVSFLSSVRAFDSRTLEPLTPSFHLPGEIIDGVSSAPDGHEVVVNATKGWQLIDLDAQTPIGPIFPYPAFSLAGFSGNEVNAPSPAGTDEVWNCAPAHVRSVACELAGRNLTEQEWQKYLSWAGPRHATCAQYPLS
jgi:WD40 repeat protein